MIYKHLLIAFLSSTFLIKGVSQENIEKELDLDSCILIALENNYELKVFEQNKNIAEKQYEIQKATLFPTIDISSEYFFTDQFKALDTYSSGNASLQLYQTIWQNGKLKSVLKQAKINAKTSEIQFSINKTDIAYYTIVNYINLLRNEQIKDLTSEILNRFTVTVHAAQERFQLGVSKRSDVLKAETEYSNIQYLFIKASTSAKIAKQNLLKAIGSQPDKSVKIKDFLESKYFQLESIKMDSLIIIAENNLPELKLIDKQIDRQEQSVLVQKKNLYPEIGAFASYNWSDNPLYDKSFYGAAGLSLKLNLFGGFRKKNSIALEKIRLDQMNLQENETIQSVMNEIQIAQLRLTEALEKISNALSRVKSSKESLVVTTEEYLQGLSSMLELVDAQYVDFEANQSLINARAEYQLAIAILKRKTDLLTLQYNL